MKTKRTAHYWKMDDQGEWQKQFYVRCRVGFCRKKAVRLGLCDKHLGAIKREEALAKEAKK